MTIIIAISKIFLNIIYAVIKIFPVKDKVTILSRQSDNPSLDIRMLSDEIIKQSPGTSVIILCKKINKGLINKIKYLPHILKQMWHMGRSGIIITDSYSIAISCLKQRRGTKVVQIWHALGALKKFGKSIVGNEGEGRDAVFAKSLNMHEHYTDILASSEKCRSAYAEAFGYNEDRIFIGSLPRVDCLRNDEYIRSCKERICQEYEELIDTKGRKVIIYAPTFRAKRDISEDIISLASKIDTDKYIFIIKKHPLMDLKIEVDNIIFDEKFTTIEMLTISDIVICDYSAIIFEAAIMKKSLIFYAFDIEEYLEKRDFYLDYAASMPGLICKTPDDLVHAIDNNRFYPDKVKKFASDYVQIMDNCTESLARHILLLD